MNATSAKTIKNLWGRIHFSRASIFPFLGGVFAILLIIFMWYMIRFLGTNLQNAFSPVIPQGGALQFDTAGYEKLNLGKSP